MKNYIGQILKYAACLLSLALAICLILTVDTAAQKRSKAKPAPKETIYWYVNYSVTIKGKGEKKDGLQTIKWSIDRTYSGSLNLNRRFEYLTWLSPKGMSQAEILDAFKTKRLTEYQFHPAKWDADFMEGMRVTIKDHVWTIVKEHGEGDSFEETTTGTQWDFDEVVKGWGGLFFGTDEKSLTYNIAVPLHGATPLQVKMFSFTLIDRSSFGYGDQPTHEAPPPTETLVPLSSLIIPNVKGLIKDGEVRHTPSRPFPPNFRTTWEYDSGDLEPDEPLIRDIPDSRTNLKIRVHYKFSRTPLY